MGGGGPWCSPPPAQVRWSRAGPDHTQPSCRTSGTCNQNIIRYIIKNSKQKDRDALNIQIFFFFFRLNQFPSGCRISEKAGKGAEHATGFFKAKQRKFLLFCTSKVNLMLDIWYVYTVQCTVYTDNLNLSIKGL